MIQTSNIRGIATMVLAAGAFVANDTCMKLALADAPPLHVPVMRGAAACLLAVESPIAVTPRLAILMGTAGFFLMCGHLFIFLAYRFTRATLVAPFNYTFTVWAVVSGIVVFGDVPNALAIGGMALILLTGLTVILLEGRVRQSESAPENSPSTL